MIRTSARSKENAPRRSGAETTASVGGVADDGNGVAIVGAGRAAEIAEEPALTEFRRCQRERDLMRSRALARAKPGRSHVNAAGGASPCGAASNRLIQDHGAQWIAPRRVQMSESVRFRCESSRWSAPPTGARLPTACSPQRAVFGLADRPLSLRIWRKGGFASRNARQWEMVWEQGSAA